MNKGLLISAISGIVILKASQLKKKLNNIDFEIKNVSLKDISNDVLTFDITLKVYNPYDIDFKIISYKTEGILNKAIIAKSESKIPRKVLAAKETFLTLPISIDLKEILNHLKSDFMNVIFYPDKINLKINSILNLRKNFINAKFPIDFEYNLKELIKP